MPWSVAGTVIGCAQTAVDCMWVVTVVGGLAVVKLMKAEIGVDIQIRPKDLQTHIW